MKYMLQNIFQTTIAETSLPTFGKLLQRYTKESKTYHPSIAHKNFTDWWFFYYFYFVITSLRLPNWMNELNNAIDTYDVIWTRIFTKHIQPRFKIPLVVNLALFLNFMAKPIQNSKLLKFIGRKNIAKYLLNYKWKNLHRSFFT